MKKLFENWNKFIKESEVADAADELADELRKKSEKDAEEQEEEDDQEEEQEKQIKLMNLKLNAPTPEG
jgi:hypothetical protein